MKAVLVFGEIQVREIECQADFRERPGGARDKLRRRAKFANLAYHGIFYHSELPEATRIYTFASLRVTIGDITNNRIILRLSSTPWAALACQGD